MKFTLLPMFYSAAFVTANHTQDHSQSDSLVDDGDLIAVLMLCAGLCVIYCATKSVIRCTEKLFSRSRCCRDNNDRVYALPEDITLTV